MRKQKMITAAVAKQLPALYAQDGSSDPTVYLKLFNPCGAATWYITEWDGEDTFFGYADLGDPMCAELGYISKSELENLRLPMGLYIERDAHWTPTLLSKVKSGEKR
jgi:hypothetical protein